MNKFYHKVLMTLIDTSLTPSFKSLLNEGLLTRDARLTSQAIRPGRAAHRRFPFRPGLYREGTDRPLGSAPRFREPSELADRRGHTIRPVASTCIYVYLYTRPLGRTTRRFEKRALQTGKIRSGELGNSTDERFIALRKGKERGTSRRGDGRGRWR